MVQWLRHHLPKQGYGFDPWLGKISYASWSKNQNIELDILLFYTCCLATFPLVVMHITCIKCYTSLLLMCHTDFLGHLVSIHKSSVAPNFICILSQVSYFPEATTHKSVMKISISRQPCSMPTTPVCTETGVHCLPSQSYQWSYFLRERGDPSHNSLSLFTG